MNINQIILQTSRDRTYVIKAIKTLEKAKLVKRRPSKTRKQMEFIELRQMGAELINFMKNIEWYRKSFHSLSQSIDKNFDFKEYSIMNKERLRMTFEEKKTDFSEASNEYLMSEKLLRNKQRAKGWADTEIGSHNQWIEEADEFQSKSAGTFIAGLFTKYMSLSLKHRSNEISRTILTKIVMDALNQHLTYTYKLLRHNFAKSRPDSEAREEANLHIRSMFSLNSIIWDYFNYFSEERTVYPDRKSTPPTFWFDPKIKNRFLVTDVVNVMESIANMFEYDVWGVDDTIEKDYENSRSKDL